jgi:hypothetical protein
MGVTVLGRADARSGGCRQVVAIEALYLMEVRRQTPAAGAPADNHGTTKKRVPSCSTSFDGSGEIGGRCYSRISSNG